MPHCHGGGNESSELPGHHGSSSRVLGEAFAKRQGSAQDGPLLWRGISVGYLWFLMVFVPHTRNSFDFDMVNGLHSHEITSLCIKCHGIPNKKLPSGNLT